MAAATAPPTASVHVAGVSALKDGINYMLLEPMKSQHVFRNPLEKLPTALFLVGSATVVVVVMQNYSINEISQSVADFMASIRALLFDRGPRPPAPAARAGTGMEPVAPITAAAAAAGVSTAVTPAASSAEAAGGRKKEIAALPLGLGAATVSDVYEDQEDRRPSETVGSPDSWTIVSPIAPGGGSGFFGGSHHGSAADAPGDAGQALSARLNAIMQRTAQRAAGDAATLHPATVGHSKRENWSDSGDPREATFDQADTNPVFAGAEWKRGSGGGYQPAVRRGDLDGRSQESSWVGIPAGTSQEEEFE